MDRDDDMHIEDDWKKQEFRNWVRGAKGLEYLQKGLQNDVAKLVLRHRDQTVQNIASFVPGTLSQCTQCSGNNLLPEHAVQNDCRYNCIQRKSVNCFGSRKRNRRVCPNGFCSKLYDEIVHSHRHKDPLWTNTDPSTWCSDSGGWSFAKCFQTTPSPGISSSETDAAGLLSIILNDTFFQNEVGCNLAAPNNYFSVAREIRNTLLHSSKMELEDTKLQDYINTFIAVLQDRMFKDVLSREAVQSLVQMMLYMLSDLSRLLFQWLKNNEITISLREEVKLVQVRMKALRALEHLQEMEQEVVSKLETQSQEALIVIKKAKLSALDEMAKSEIHQRLRETQEKILHLNNRVERIEMENTRVPPPTPPDNLTFQDAYRRKKKATEEAYNQLKTKLRNDLIEFYRSKHSTVQLSPLLDKEDDTPLLEFYVMPDINVITLERAFGGGSEKRTHISEFRSVFFKDDRLCNEIYLAADAGMGKTSFSKRMVLSWCHAKNPNTEETRYFSEEENATMNEFDFVFLVYLRNSFVDCHIIDMVLNQILEELELKNISREDLERILHTERCLVILDGLDEWSHPENSCRRADEAIPHRKAKQCTVLTTTRPWKLNDIKASQIDQKLEIAGLSEESANSLKERVISHFCAGKEQPKRVEDFNSSVEEKKILNLVKIPIMLMYFVCLFCENRGLGRSLCMLYINITDMLFNRTVKIYKKIPELSKIDQSEIPECFKENKFCKQFYTILIALGKLAFHTLLRDTREENTLIFDRSVVDQFLNEDYLNFCLRTGILTQSRIRGKLIKQETKLSFAHKTIHEFFAALHSITDSVSFQEKLLSKCKCVKDILKMSKVLIFVSGMNEKLLSMIFPEVINIVKNDQITQEYRSTIADRGSSCWEQLKELQDLCVACSREFICELQHNLCLQDVFIDESCREEQYCKYLTQLTTRNASDIRSLYIDNTSKNVIDCFNFSDLKYIEKVHYQGDCNDVILSVINSSVKSLCLSRTDGIPNFWSHLLFEKVKSLQKLEAFKIKSFRMSHSEYGLLLDYISQRYCLKAIELERLFCTDHDNGSLTDYEEDSEDSEENLSFDHGENPCTGLGVDLTRHSSLKVLQLTKLPLTQVVVNMSSLEMLFLHALSKPDLVVKFLNCADCRLDTFICNALNSFDAIEAVLDTLRLLRNVERFLLANILLLRTRTITFSHDLNIKSLTFFQVAMEISEFRKLVESVNKFQNSVTVSLLGCYMLTEDFNQIRIGAVTDKMKNMQKQYRILDDKDDIFQFETINNGD